MFARNGAKDPPSPSPGEGPRRKCPLKESAFVKPHAGGEQGSEQSEEVHVAHVHTTCVLSVVPLTQPPLPHEGTGSLTLSQWKARWEVGTPRCDPDAVTKSFSYQRRKSAHFTPEPGRVQHLKVPARLHVGKVIDLETTVQTPPENQ